MWLVEKYGVNLWPQNCNLMYLFKNSFREIKFTGLSDCLIVSKRDSDSEYVGE